jgi:2-C-methyl-D-erythritol 2,4-cyclodiphosphate synthase
VIRVGIGFDAHRFDDARPLVLGGVVIPDSPGLAGHSDADVLAHAIADALLGAAQLGDLGEHFPNDERWKEASSVAILEETSRMIADEGWTVASVDATVIAERPALAPFRDAMRSNIAKAIGVYSGEFSVKATTTDGMGFTGRGEGIACMVVAALYRPDPEPSK